VSSQTLGSCGVVTIAVGLASKKQYYYHSFALPISVISNWFLSHYYIVLLDRIGVTICTIARAVKEYACVHGSLLVDSRYQDQAPS